MADKPPDAFLSYTRFDDRHDGGAISRFRTSLESAVRAVSGEPFEIFQDVDDIGVGERWSDKLTNALDEVRFFIPILTPGYFRSPACRDELKKFLEAETRAGRDDLILPIYYIESPVLEEKALRDADELAAVTAARQMWDWRELRHYSFGTRKVRIKIEALARQIDEARRRAMPPPPAARARPANITTPVAEPGTSIEPKPSVPAFRDVEQPWCPEMVEVPAGEFMMGSTEAERQWAVSQGALAEWVECEKPQHLVRIGYRLAIGRYPVTFEEFDRFADATGRWRPGDEDEEWGRGRRPVINVSWNDAKAYVEWLGGETGQPYRLPSEAEWEYACRAGTTTRYAWGDEITREHANFGENVGRTSEVGGYPANPWGLYDMHGNVWEWVDDRWHDNYTEAPNDGTAWIRGKAYYRVLRGGAWRGIPWVLRAACRLRIGELNSFDDLGFRVAMTLAA